MPYDIELVVENPIKIGRDSVWGLADDREIDYSDGPAIQKKLESILAGVSDRSVGSEELQGKIDDWPTEYYFTRKRSQLLSGFNFRRSQKVLEIGCGYGAVTRYLGETFDDVVSVEGSRSRARIARMRSADLKNVSIVCAPFQELRFRKKFDVIFCVGVWEYSKIFVDSERPFDKVLEIFRGLLAPGGVLVLAIENQFGLKYFSGAGEDHNNIRFDGLEGYPRHDKERTFGYVELKRMLAPHFPAMEFYFPYPDYKTPVCVLSERFFSRVNAGELVGGIPHNPYLNYPKPLFDEPFVLPELARNGMLPFFSNSFLVVAGEKDPLPVRMEALGQYFNTSRLPRFQTITRFLESTDGSIRSIKRAMKSEVKAPDGELKMRPCDDEWQTGPSLHVRVLSRCKRRDLALAEIFSPCAIWVETLKKKADGAGLLDGCFFDAIWRNSYLKNGECVFVDQEWEWPARFGLGVLVIRCVNDFLEDVSHLSDTSPLLRSPGRKALICRISTALGVEVTNADFDAFREVESKVCGTVFGGDPKRHGAYLRLLLWNVAAVTAARDAGKLARRVAGRVGRFFK